MRDPNAHVFPVVALAVAGAAYAPALDIGLAHRDPWDHGGSRPHAHGQRVESPLRGRLPKARDMRKSANRERR